MPKLVLVVPHLALDRIELVARVCLHFHVVCHDLHLRVIVHIMEHALLARAVLIYYDWRGQNLNFADFVINDGLLRI